MTRPGRTPKRLVPIPKQPGAMTELRRALTRRKKSELVDALIELAQDDRGVLRQLNARFDVGASPEEPEALTRQAIRDATAFDVRDINRNFAYDYGAYAEVKRNLGRLIASGQLRLAMQLAMELMKHGSYQVEMSDEGLMTDDIEDCLKVVIESLTTSDVSAMEVIAWCTAMRASDRVSFIAEKPLEALRRRCKRARFGRPTPPHCLSTCPLHRRSVRHPAFQPYPPATSHPSPSASRHLTHVQMANGISIPKE